MKHALQASEAELQTHEYRIYKTTVEAAGQTAMDPLRWYLLSMVGPLEADEESPPTKRACVAAGGADHMDQDAM